MEAARRRWMARAVLAALVVMSGVQASRLRVGAGHGAACRWRASLEDGRGARFELCADTLALSLADSSRYANSFYTPQARVSPAKCPSAAAAPTAQPGVPHPAPAHPGYERLATGGHYKVHDHKAPWREARAACEAEGAHLVVLDSKEEAAALKQLLQEKPLATEEEPEFRLHAGFYVDLVTVTGHSLSLMEYDRWAPWQPAAEICGSVDQDAWLRFSRCSARLHFVCEHSPPPQPPPAHHAPSPDPEKRPAPEHPRTEPPHSRRSEERGYWAVPGWNASLYKMHDERTHWKHAQWKCEQEGAHLLVVDAPEEADALLEHFQRRAHPFPHRVFVGVSSGPALDVLGSPMSASGYNRWVSKSAEDACVAVDVKFLFHITPCGKDELDYVTTHDLLPFICEQSDP